MILNRNNADINSLRDKKVAVRLVGKDAEVDFRKWLKENGIHFNDKEVLLIRKGIRTEVSYCVEGNSWDWCDKKWFIEKGYNLYEWEIAEEEEEKTYTIKDVVENKGKVYKDEHDTLYFYDGTLYCRTPKEKKFRPSLLNLQQMLDLELTEYKEEPKKITFKEALKEMETKVCRCLFSNRCITVYCSQYGSQFIDASNGEFTNLSLPELQSEWTVVNE